MKPPIAHSARRVSDSPQLYADHVAGVVESARHHAAAMLAYARDPAKARKILSAIEAGAEYHDLGKLDSDTQAGLRRGRGAKLNWDHIDAGVAHLSSQQALMAAWLVRAHHSPGLPAKGDHFGRGDTLKLRGGRKTDAASRREQIARTDADLTRLLDLHRSVVPGGPSESIGAMHGLPMRLALSCLVDADHSDTARADGSPPRVSAPPPRWEERLAALDLHVDELTKRGGARSANRRAFYDACRTRAPDAALIACEGPVGIGKTTAVLAYLLRRAMETNARRMFVVAPFTAILGQTALVLRKALLLPDEAERPFDIVAEHHHRADFDDIASRDLATLWTAPIVLTTSVQFLETLSSNAPASLRKLHMLPGSVVFLDEAHALAPMTARRRRADGGEAVETRMLPQYWRWFRELAANWGCSFVFASGSLARFWGVEDLVGDCAATLPDLVPASLAPRLLQAEEQRVRFMTHPRFDSVDDLLRSVASRPGPRLVIFNTVQSAAVVASKARARGANVLHLSTALCPRDRERILAEVKARLAQRDMPDWMLVATSLVEAGVDISFATAFRERFSLTSLLQVAGRVNRHGELEMRGEVHDFQIEKVEGLTNHPDAELPADVVARMLEAGSLDGAFDAAALVTEAWRREGKRTEDLLKGAETDRHYPDVAALGRLIDADTRLVVVDPDLAARLEAHEQVSMRDLLGGSVQIWAPKLGDFALPEIHARPGVFRWTHDYDPEFLGYMEGALKIADIAAGEALIL